MLNTEQLATYIEQPELIRSEDVETLRELAEKHPYSSVYSLLYLQGVSKYQSVHLDEILPKQAYKLSDRIRLYHLLHTAYESNAVVEEQPIAIEVAATEVTPEPLQVISEPSKPNLDIEEEIVVEKIPEEVTPIETTSETNSANAIESIHEEPVVEEVVVEEVATPIEEKSIFDFEMVAETLGQDFLVTKTKEEETTASEEKDVPAEVVEQKLVQISEEVEKNYPKELSDAKRSFTSWLKASEEKSQPKPTTEPEQKISPQEMIDKFIETSPSMSRPQSEFFSPSKKAKESIDENRIPVSETLAKIFAAQGNFPKAIHVYHQLILAFPEKKSLFALQIEELKKKITS